ncbi:lipoate--protein ligase family protein [Saccharolobus islandicus]|uniref:Biotin/lipoate A/B protein ligase n=1 Tax=Saccharolobus islandicus (strain L.D.8.5 / Lassen \|nr:biotin/lipoate A/B protein ligase family protein [Sulfolobus islandicus]ADB86902.1 biotin/lipoate A/B protein ligase [Sulfolobus islandicus L.D.8.5]
MRELRFLVERNNQAYILAGEEALLLSVANGYQPVLRFVIFDPPAVLIGYHQAVEQEVNIEEVKKRGWEIGRRPTGGGTIIMGPWQLGWEIYASNDLLGYTPESAIKIGAEGVIRALDKLGIKASFRPKNDVEVNGRKISGIGAFSEGKYIAVTGTILLDFDADAMVSVLRLSSEKLKDKLARDFKDRLTWINKELTRPIDMEELIKISRDSFAETLGVKLVDGNCNEFEKKTIHELGLKYSSPEWIFNLRRPLIGDNIRYVEKKLPGGLVKVQVKMASKNLIESVLITGDFFIEPRNAIYDLEARLKWSRVEDLEDEIKTWFNSVKAIGITADNLIKIIEEAVR